MHDEFVEAPSPTELGNYAFAVANSDLFDKYVMLRVHGIHSVIAFKRVFPSNWDEDSNAHLRRAAIEFNPYVVSKLRDMLAVVAVGDLWNPRLSVHEMLSLARDPYAKDATRLGAMKELNIMCNITIVDENGKTKAGRSLDDFYNDLAHEKVPAAPTTTEENAP